MIAKLDTDVVEVRLVTVGSDDEGFQVIGDDDARQGPEEAQGLGDAVDEVGRGLGRQSNGERVLRVRHDGHQYLTGVHLSRLVVDPRQGFTGVVNLHLFSRLMTQRQGKVAPTDGPRQIGVELGLGVTLRDTPGGIPRRASGA